MICAFVRIDGRPEELIYCMNARRIPLIVPRT